MSIPKPSKKQAWALGIGAALLILLLMFIRGRGPLVVNQGGAGDGPVGDVTAGPTYLTYNNPPREGNSFGGNTYGGLTYISNPPGNCGGRQYYVSNDVMSRSHKIEDVQNLTWDSQYSGKALEQLLIGGWRS